MFLLAFSSTITMSGELMLYFIWSMVHLDCHFPCHLTSFIAQQLLIFLSVFTWLEFQLNKFSTSLQQWWILNTENFVYYRDLAHGPDWGECSAGRMGSRRSVTTVSAFTHYQKAPYRIARKHGFNQNRYHDSDIPSETLHYFPCILS